MLVPWTAPARPEIGAKRTLSQCVRWQRHTPQHSYNCWEHKTIFAKLTRHVMVVHASPANVKSISLCDANTNKQWNLLSYFKRTMNVHISLCHRCACWFLYSPAESNQSHQCLMEGLHPFTGQSKTPLQFSTSHHHANMETITQTHMKVQMLMVKILPPHRYVGWRFGSLEFSSTAVSGMRAVTLCCEYKSWFQSDGDRCVFNPLHAQLWQLCVCQCVVSKECVLVRSILLSKGPANQMRETIAKTLWCRNFVEKSYFRVQDNPTRLCNYLHGTDVKKQEEHEKR